MARTKSEVVMYHNPACTTSRKVLGGLRPRGGRAGRVELLTGIEGTSSRPVRRIVLRKG